MDKLSPYLKDGPKRMNRVVLKITLLLCFVAVSLHGLKVQAQAVDQSPVLAAKLNFSNGIFATQPSDKRLYVLLGSGFLRPLSFGEPNGFIEKWLHDHPSSIVIPVSRMLSTNTRTHVQNEIVYVWIVDGPNNLNVDLVRAGIFASGTMFDMVDNQKGLDELLKHDPKLADARAEIERERASAPQDRTERLVSESDYKAVLNRFGEAESYARSQKLGIWSDAMKEERDSEGVR